MDLLLIYFNYIKLTLIVIHSTLYVGIYSPVDLFLFFIAIVVLLRRSMIIAALGLPSWSSFSKLMILGYIGAVAMQKCVHFGMNIPAALKTSSVFRYVGNKYCLKWVQNIPSEVFCAITEPLSELNKPGLIFREYMLTMYNVVKHWVG